MDEVEYKVVETSIVTDDTLTELINEYVRAGWIFNGIQFAMKESSNRPSMAFIIFTRKFKPSE